VGAEEIAVEEKEAAKISVVEKRGREKKTH